MIRIFAAILILAMTLFVPSTWAESKHIEEILFSSECAVAFMQMKLLENRERFSGEKQTGFADRLLDLNFTAPSEAYVFYLTDQQADTAAKGMNTVSGLLVQQIASDMNGRMDADYPVIAGQSNLSMNMKISYDLAKGTTFVLLTYPQDFVLICIRGGEISAMFITGDAAPEGDNVVFIGKILAACGVQDIKYVEYSSDALAQIITDKHDSWTVNTKGGGMMNLLALYMGKSIDAYRLLFPYIAKSRWGGTQQLEYFLGQLSGVLMDYAGVPGGADGRLALTRLIAEEIDPDMASRFGSLWQYNNNSTSRAGEWPLDKLPLLTDDQSTDPFNPKKTVVFIHERYKADDNKEIKYNFYVLSALNIANIPQSVGSADYIAYARTNWEEYKKSNGVTLMSAITTMKLYDAKTGKCLMDLGTQRDVPSGYIVATSRIWYLQPNVKKLAAKLVELFQ